MKFRHTNWLVLSLFMAACASPKLSNLEKGTYRFSQEVAPTDIVRVKVGVLPIVQEEKEQPKATTFLDMRDSLPHLYLKLLASKIKDPDTFISRLSRPVIPLEKKGAAAKKQTDYTEYKVQFVLSNHKRYYADKRFMHPNTRLEALSTDLTIAEGGPIRFYNINKLQNEFEDIDLGSLSRDQVVSVGAKLGLTGGLGGTSENTSGDKSTTSNSGEKTKGKTAYDADGNVIGTISKKGTFSSVDEGSSGNKTTAQANIGGSAEGSYQNSETIKEAIAVKLKRLKTGFSFSDKTLTISQGGRPSADISENTYVTATLKVSDPKNTMSLPVWAFGKLYDEKGKPIAADKLSYEKRTAKFVPCDSAKDISIKTEYEGAVRAVRNIWGRSGNNALEYDDKVAFYRIDKANADPIVIDKNVYCKNAYNFVIIDAATKKKFILKIADPSHNELAVFIDDDPGTFLQWLTDNKAEPDKKRLSSSKFSLYFDDDRGNTIPFVRDKITDSQIEAIRKLGRITSEERKMP